MYDRLKLYLGRSSVTSVEWKKRRRLLSVTARNEGSFPELQRDRDGVTIMTSKCSKCDLEKAEPDGEDLASLLSVVNTVGCC